MPGIFTMRRKGGEETVLYKNNNSKSFCVLRWGKEKGGGGTHTRKL